MAQTPQHSLLSRPPLRLHSPRASGLTSVGLFSLLLGPLPEPFTNGEIRKVKADPLTLLWLSGPGLQEKGGRRHGWDKDGCLAWLKLPFPSCSLPSSDNCPQPRAEPRQWGGRGLATPLQPAILVTSPAFHSPPYRRGHSSPQEQSFSVWAHTAWALLLPV